ncbi:LPS export ABC transporter ATP-binding protein [Methylocystis sp.]|uniref:LPS export ABC transporter ATP-binding protein n=1 Tax=Methylocystis sp. TaxID=1911079 RepID=UPI0027339707|nr:LPS export ABC transporter ATP-binding protein [Methylocystis sp.]MDP3554568.1 LPS export ABC transporter ATP-binding protein [Methylocystis sp.]
MSYLSALSMRFRAAGQSLARLANGVRRSRKPDDIAEGQWRDAQNLGADSDEAARDASFWGPTPTNEQAEPPPAFEPGSSYREPAGFDGQGLLSIHNLAKSYKARRVVEDVSLHVARGEAVGLLGPNGAGKTTVFYMITGLVKPDKGMISLDGYDVTPLPMYRRARLGIGYLPQEASVFRGLSVEDNIRAVLEITQPDVKKREEELEALLEEFRLTRMRHTPAVALSGGERRRCEIARALAGHPSFMLLDEPFAGIDPIAVGGIQDLVRHLKARGIGVLITDHSVRETLGLTDRAYIIYNGHVLTEGTPDEIVANPDVRRIYLGEDFRM